MQHIKSDKHASESRRLVTLAQLAERWQCSRQTARRVLARHEVRPLYLGGDARNATLRFDLADVEIVEGRSQAEPSESTRESRGHGPGNREEESA